MQRSRRPAAGARPPARRRNAVQAPPPVTITVTEDGRLMLSSADPLALDRMEELIEQLSPPEKRFKVYPPEAHPGARTCSWT